MPTTRRSATPPKPVSKSKQPPIFSEVLTFHDFVFLAGQGVATGSIGEQTTATIDLIEAALKKAGTSLKKCLKANVHLKNLDDFAAMNAAYQGRFGNKPPVRTTVQVAGIVLPGCLVEIDVVAHR